MTRLLPFVVAAAAALGGSSCATTGAASGASNGTRPRAAADFDLPALGGAGTDGDRVKLASTKGHVVLLDFWASWCGPCRQELPALEALKKEYGDKLVVLTVNIDSDAEAAATMKKQLDVTLPVALDADKQVASAYDLPTMPTSYVIDRDGMVRYVHQGFYGQKDVEHFHQEIDELLK